MSSFVFVHYYFFIYVRFLHPSFNAVIYIFHQYCRQKIFIMKPNLFYRAMVCFMTLVLFKTVSAQTFEGLGYLHNYEFSDSQASDVSSDGSVIVGTTISLHNETIVKEAFRWTEEEGMQGLGALWLEDSRFFSQGLNISDDGQVIVGYSKSENSFMPWSSMGWEAFRWTEDEGMQGLGDLTPSDYWSEATSTSSDGSVIVGRSFSTSSGFRWNNGTMESLSTEDIRFAEAWAVSGDGTVVVGAGEIDGLPNQACMWVENEGIFGLGMPENSNSMARNVSADGNTIVGYIFDDMSNPSAFIWTQETGVVELGSLGGSYTAVESISDDGTIAVGAGTTQDNDFVALIWTEENGVQNLKEVMETTYGLDMTGWTLILANAVSGDGKTIVGTGTNPDGKQEAWRIVLPESTVNLIVTTQSSPIEGGETNGGGTFQNGQTCTVTALPNNDYVFENWTENGIVVSTDNEYNFTVTEDINLIANFESNLSINNEFSNNQIVVYPNPTTGIVNLQTEQQVEKVSVYNLAGQKMTVSSINKENTSINISNLPNGAYFIEVILNNNSVAKKYKVIKK